MNCATRCLCQFNIVNFHEYSWTFMKFHGLSWNFHENLRAFFINFHEISWIFINFFSWVSCTWLSLLLKHQRKPFRHHNIVWFRFLVLLSFAASRFCYNFFANLTFLLPPLPFRSSELRLFSSKMQKYQNFHSNSRLPNKSWRKIRSIVPDWSDMWWLW